MLHSFSSWSPSLAHSVVFFDAFQNFKMSTHLLLYYYSVRSFLLAHEEETRVKRKEEKRRNPAVKIDDQEWEGIRQNRQRNRLLFVSYWL